MEKVSHRPYSTGFLFGPPGQYYATSRYLREWQVVALVKKQHEKAAQLLLQNRGKLDQLAKYLYEKETITGDEFMEILNREG